MIKLELATIEDSRDIYQWRNDPLTREMSINTQIVKISVHRKWFNSSLENKDRHLFMCVDINKNKIGLVRFDIEGDTGLVSINLNPNKRNQGLAKLCLKESIIKLQNCSPKIRILKAKIKKINYPSKKTFEGIGFKFHYQYKNLCHYEMKLK